MTNQTPLISVIIPTYNREKIIKKTIDSVLRQNYKNFELLVVDDASTDNTESVVKSIEDKRVRYIRLEENTRGTRPRNLGIELSNGEFIAFLDSDDEWLPEKLEKQLDHILKSGLSKMPVMCFTGVIKSNGRSKLYIKNKPYINNQDILDYILVDDNIVQTSTYMVTSILAKAALFDPNLKKHQDWDFCLRLKQNNAMFLQVRECLTVWNDDNKKDRISKNYKNETLSLDWFNRRKNDLSEKSQRAFKVIILVDKLISEKKIMSAIEITFSAFFSRSIKLKVLLKTLVKFVFPVSVQNKLKDLFGRFVK